MRFSITALASVCVLQAAVAAQAEIIDLPVLRDNTIFESPNTNSNALGETFFAGASGGAAAMRRGLLAFDLSGIPSGAQIDRVTLQLTLADAASQETAARNVSLHRLTSDWGEGTSNAGNTGGSGNGVAATVGDATWLMQFYNTDSWTTPGGDFVTGPSATASVGMLADVGSVYEWETLRGAAPTGLVLDVDSWLADPTQNFGWLVKLDNEAILRTVRRFYSDAAASATLRPSLEVEYSFNAAAVPEPSSLAGMLSAAGVLFATILVRERRRLRAERP